jgi:hypothetical protein
MVKYTTIRVEKKILKDIKKLKYFPKQTNYEVIAKLCKKHTKDQELEELSLLQRECYKDFWDSEDEVWDEL